MGFRNAKLARIAAGAAIVSTAGLTTAVAVAHNSPSGSYGSDDAGEYTKTGYGVSGEHTYGFESDDGGEGQARGHRLHCPSYNGIVHSKGHAQCHMAPRHGEHADDSDDTQATQQKAGTLDLDETNKSTTTTGQHSDLDGKSTNTTDRRTAARRDADESTTSTTEATSPSATSDDSVDSTSTTSPRRDGDHRDGRSGTDSGGSHD